jgi:hypothetical protein
MWALYSLACRVRTLYALLHGVVTLVQGGWTALTPAQLLVPGLVLCIVLRALIPSASSARLRPVAFMDRLLDAVSAASAIGLTVAGVADSFASSASLVALVLCR